jgi:rhodanese-related sulfurtransferase
MLRSALPLLCLAAFACADPKPAPAPAPAPAPPPAPEPVDESGLRDRDIPLAKKLISEGAILLDVRTPGEFERGAVKGAVLMPVQELGSHLKDIKKMAKGDMDKPIVVYCASGVRSGRAKAMLKQAGFTKVVNAGGYADFN